MNINMYFKKKMAEIMFIGLTTFIIGYETFCVLKNPEKVTHISFSGIA